jgi:hypothetical protein
MPGTDNLYLIEITGDYLLTVCPLSGKNEAHPLFSGWPEGKA